jgi:DNA-binding NarL/FixJ family response regulator
MDGVAIRLLIVDDHPSFRATARALLEADGFEVVGEAADGESALAAARATRPDVILLDIQLPDMDGFEVVERLMANGTPPVIVLTSTRDLSEYGTLVDGSGARGFVPKAELSGSTLGALLA